MNDDTTTAVYVDDGAILALAPFIRRVVRSCGVRPADVEDVAQTATYAAIFAARAGVFCPEPERDQGDALRSWIAGFCWRSADALRRRTWREVPAGLTPGEGIPVDPRAQIEARDAVATLRHLGRDDREMLVARADGDTITQIAEARHVPHLDARRRIERSRRIVAAILAKGVPG